MISAAQGRRTNNPTALPVEGATRGDDFAAFDQLPAAVRAEIAQQVTKLGAASVLAYFRSIERQAAECGGSPLDAEAWTLRKLRTIEGQELDCFAAQHRAQHRYALPHIAAEATVQRYGAPVPRQHQGRSRDRRRPHIRGFSVIEVATC